MDIPLRPPPPPPPPPPQKKKSRNITFSFVSNAAVSVTTEFDAVKFGGDNDHAKIERYPLNEWTNIKKMHITSQWN